MKTLESFFSRTAQFGLLIYLTGCFGLLIVLGAAVAKWLKLIDVIQYIAFAFGLGLLTLLMQEQRNQKRWLSSNPLFERRLPQ